ncbi:MAG TPA: cysteine desulfurase family protein [Candidatus Nanopelagicales bacterium]
MRAYLDHAATTPLLECARDAMVGALAHTGNASSLHTAGRLARRRLEEAREAIAGSLGVAPSEVIFTAGGTEADNLAVKGLWWGRTAADSGRRRVLASRIEHHAVLDPVHWLGEHEGAEVVWLDVDGEGRVDADQVAEELRTAPGRTALVSVMWANNEVGTVQPIEAIAQACAEADVPLHVDGVQAVGSIPVACDLPTTLAISAHKLGGPMGVGALVARRAAPLAPLSHGGGQERQVRSGTADVPAIAGFAAAVEHVLDDLALRAPRLVDLRDMLVEGVLAIAPDAVVNGAMGGPEVRLPGNAHVSFPGCEGDALLMLLDAAGVDVSTGSACTAGVPEPSHVLLAMGIDPILARSSVRMTLGHSSTPAEVEALLSALPAALDRARRAGQVRIDARLAASVRAEG